MPERTGHLARKLGFISTSEAVQQAEGAARAEKTRIRELVLVQVKQLEDKQILIASQIGYDKLNILRQLSSDRWRDEEQPLMKRLIDNLSAMASMLQVVDCIVDMREPHVGYRLISGDTTRSRREWTASVDGIEKDYTGLYLVIEVPIVDDQTGEVFRRGRVKRLNSDEERDSSRQELLNGAKSRTL